ncbi:MAG TPA: hypothetical protein DCE41_33795 [Cytophagales bacterium]|nr:hypothetical protein [Cytophagales bacterium]HAA21285.1 hypothetical protein [Cytophagales bacterium]HAP59404.1 hypothetical protein [Cytophagales bacterium]
MRKLFSAVLLLGMATLLMNHTPVEEVLLEESEAMCIAPGTVQMLATVPVNCSTTIYAFSQFATGANWTVSGGTIVSGQGTLSIEVVGSGNVTVTCRAFNECAYSTNTASRTYNIPCFFLLPD